MLESSIERSKRCVRCGVTKPASELYIKKSVKDGLDSWCKECSKNRSVELRREYARINMSGDAVPVVNKKCSKRHEIKPASEFHPNAYIKDGLRTYCKKCHIQYRREMGENNKDVRVSVWASHALLNHRRKGHVINLSTEDLAHLAKNTSHCPICGQQFDWSPNKKTVK